MIRLNIHEVKAHLSAYLDRLAKGETIILCKRKLLLPRFARCHYAGRVGGLSDWIRESSWFRPSSSSRYQKRY